MSDEKIGAGIRKTAILIVRALAFWAAMAGYFVLADWMRSVWFPQVAPYNWSTFLMVTIGATVFHRILLWKDDVVVGPKP